MPKTPQEAAKRKRRDKASIDGRAMDVTP